jgi:uroporphyrinogen decarboxylase
MLSPRDNLLRTLRRQGFDQVPVDIELCPSQVEAFRARFGHDDYRRYFGVGHAGAWVGLDATFTDGRALYRGRDLPDGTDVDPWGVGHSKGSDAAMHMTRMHHPLAGDISVDAIERYPFPEIAPDALARATADVERGHAAGLAVVGYMACTVWETAWYMRSMEDLMVDMASEEPTAEMLLDKVTAISRARARTYAQAGVDILHLGDDIGTQRAPMMSVELWQAWLAPRLRAVIAEARSVKPDVLVFYHSCGYVLPFLDGLVDAGIDILNPVQPECMSFEDVHRRIGDRVAFWGTIGTQSTLPFGTPEDVRATVLSRLETCGARGGIVIGPTHMVEPEVPWENLVAMKAAVDELNTARR